MIKLIASQSQQKGRLLEFLARDLLISLRYQKIETREIRNGEEIDVTAVFPQPLAEGKFREIPIICECKALSSPVDIPKWNIFKGKLYTAKAENSSTIGVLISLSGVNPYVSENFNAIKRTSESGAIHLVEMDDIVASLVGLKKIDNPSSIREKIEVLCSNRLASLDTIVIPSEGEGYRCFWVQTFFDDNGKETYATILQGDGSTPGIEVCQQIVDTIILPSGKQYIPIEELNLSKITQSEGMRRILKRLISESNGQYVHLLPANATPEQIAGAIISFANTNDGKIILGVSSGGVIEGVPDAKAIIKIIFDAVSFSYCHPEIQLDEPSIVKVDGRQLVIVDVRRQSFMHCTADGRCLVRSGGTITPNFDIFTEWKFESQPISARAGKKIDFMTVFDNHILSNFKEGLVKHKPGMGKIDDKEILERFGCITDLSKNLVPTMAGTLVFGNDPSRYIRHYGVVAIRFRGIDIPGSPELYIDRLEIERPIPVATNEVLAFLRRNTRVGAKLVDTDREDISDYPIEALREATVNCLIHMDYSLSQKARIFVFDNRIEFITPGGLPRGASIQKMRSNISQHCPRNPSVCEVMQYFEFEIKFENLGTGIRKMTVAMESVGLRPPEFFDDGHEFKVILWGPADSLSEREPETLTGKTVLQIKQLDTVKVGDSLTKSDTKYDITSAEKFGFCFSKNSPFREVLAIVDKISTTDFPVLIMGETGTGKDLLAKYMHSHSKRASGPFVTIDCAALSESLVESELFGHEKGAFTGASSQRRGNIELANGGSLFLNEIGDMNLSIQAKIIKVIEGKEFRRVGGTQSVHVDVRIIVSTNRNLEKDVQKSLFRRDLYYRLNSVVIIIPPLRERLEDIPLLIDFFLKRYNCEFEKQITGIEKGVIPIFKNYSWPGNIRELEAVIQKAILLEEDQILRLATVKQTMGHIYVQPFKEAISDFEARYFANVLVQVGGNVVKAARLAGIDKTVLLRKIRNYDLSSIQK